MDNVIQIEDRVSRSRSKREGESSAEIAPESVTNLLPNDYR